MELGYSVIKNRDDLLYAGRRLIEERTMWALEPSVALTAEQWCGLVSQEDTCVITGYVGAERAGVAILRPFCPLSRCGEIGVAAYRDFFSLGLELARGVVRYIFENFDCVSLVAKVPDPNRHIMRLHKAAGFIDLGHVPGLMWYERKKAFTGGHLLLATEETLAKAIQGE